MSSIIALFLFANLNFSAQIHDFGTVKEGKVLIKSFEVRNNSKRVVTILSVSSSCSCTIPSFTKLIQSGQKGEIKVEFNTKGITGNIERKLIIVTDDTDQEYYSITLKANVVK